MILSLSNSFRHLRRVFHPALSGVPLLLCLLVVICTLLTGCSGLSEQNTVLPDSKKSRIIHAYTEMGFAYLQQNNRERARRSFVKVLALDHDNADGLHGMALIYQAEGEDALAEEHFLQALAESDGFSVARNNFAAFLYGKARYNEACEQLQRTVADTLYSRRRQAFENLGLCWLKLERWQDAEQAFSSALRLAPDSSVALLELAALNMRQEQPLAAWQFLQEYRAVARMTDRSLRLGIALADLLNKQEEHSRMSDELARLKQ